MEPEDNNNLTIAGDCITTNGDSIYSIGNTWTWEQPVVNYNVDGKIVIPAQFQVVLKKFIEGFENIRVIQYELNSGVDFLLRLELKISWDVKQLYTKKDYTEKINDLFKMTYPNNNSYKFDVKNVIGGKSDKHKEFFEFFS